MVYYDGLHDPSLLASKMSEVVIRAAVCFETKMQPIFLIIIS